MIVTAISYHPYNLQFYSVIIKCNETSITPKLTNTKHILESFQLTYQMSLGLLIILGRIFLLHQEQMTSILCSVLSSNSSCCTVYCENVSPLSWVNPIEYANYLVDHVAELWTLIDTKDTKCDANSFMFSSITCRIFLYTVYHYF